jgi:threonine dehydratase
LRDTIEAAAGALRALTRILAGQRANIVETLHSRACYGVSLSETAIDVTLETRGASHTAAIGHALRETGFRFERIQ